MGDLKDAAAEELAAELAAELTVMDAVLRGIRLWECATSYEWKAKAERELVEAHIALHQARRRVEALESELAEVKRRLQVAQDDLHYASFDEGREP